MQKKKLITHNGSFHADDIFATAALALMLEAQGEKYEVIRTRDEEIIETGDYVYDVGGVHDEEMNRFDHHQIGGAGKGLQDIEYSSFGLVWKKYGEELSGSPRGAEIIQKRLATPVDAWDNGQDLVNNIHEISPYFIQHAFLAMVPTWKEDKSITDKMFLKSVDMAKEILSREITQVKDAILAEDSVIEIYKNTDDKRIIILETNYPFEILNTFPEPLFVIYPRRTDDTWGVKAIREDSKTFKNRKDLPEAWGGLRLEQMAQASSVSDAIFCHRGLFMAVAKSKEGAIELAKIAVNS